MDVTEKQRLTQELRRRGIYLAEAQRLSHTGSFSWNVATGDILWSEETFRIFQISPAMKPTVELILQRVHPEDVALVQRTIEIASSGGKDFDHEYRLLMPDGAVKHVHVVAQAASVGAGTIEFIGAVMDVTATKQAEDRIQQIIDAVPAFIWTARPDGSLDFISQRWLDYSGLTLEQQLGRPWGAQCHPDDMDRWLSNWRAALAERAAFEAEARVKRFDGAYRWFLSRACPLFDRSRHILGWYGNDVDIHDRKLVEERLQQSEASLHDAQTLGHTGSWTYHMPSKTFFASPEMVRIFGCNPAAPDTDESMAAMLRARIHPEDRLFVEDAVTKARSNLSHSELDYRLLLADGSIKHVHSVSHPVFDDSGDAAEYIGTVIDVTERKRADEELERLLVRERSALTQALAAQQRFHDFVNSVEGIVWEAELPSFQFVFISKQAERVLGYPVERWLSEPSFWADHLHPEDRDGAVQFCQEQTGKKRNHDFEYRMIAADGRVVSLRDLVTVVVESDRATRLRGIMVDVSRRRKAEEALRQAQADLARVTRMTTMGELTASLAHEVNQPIAAAVTNANACLRWLAGEVPSLEEARAAARRIVKDGTRAAEIISRIRLLFKKGTLQRELVDVNDVIREMIVLLGNEATRYSISVRTELATDLPRIMGDRVQLQQVMMNLIMNGIDAMRDADRTRELAIKSQRAEDEQLLLSVSDTGVGLPPQRDQMFEAFFTTKVHGTGMGLSISRSIVEAHGGRLWAADNSPRGASFQFTLPTAQPAFEVS
jgi:PAS domain S-box-containing protein